MKVWFILLSILSAVLTWWWHSRHSVRHSAADSGFFRRLTHSLVAGVAVYFSLMAVAMVWLLLTT